MKNVLVVGVNGIIGGALYHALQSQNISVYGTTRRREMVGAQMYYLDLGDPIENWNFLDQEFDVVYLCAGIFRMSECEAHPDATYHLNVTKMFELIHILEGLGAHIIYLSTNQVFSGVEPYASATTSYNPPNEYGRQKVAIEILIKTHCKKWTVIRLTKVVSFRLPLFQNWLARLQQQLSIEAFYDMTMAPIALNQVVNVLIKLGEKKIVGCYQLSGTMDISYYDFAKQLSCQINQPAHFVKPVSAIKNGIHKNFLPPYTTLDCLNTIALCGVMSLQPADVLNICLENGV